MVPSQSVDILHRLNHLLVQAGTNAIINIDDQLVIQQSNNIYCIIAHLNRRLMVVGACWTLHMELQHPDCLDILFGAITYRGYLTLRQHSQLGKLLGADIASWTSHIRAVGEDVGWRRIGNGLAETEQWDSSLRMVGTDFTVKQEANRS